MPRARVLPMHPPPTPVHPFDRLYGTDTGGLLPRARIAAGHPSDRHATAYYAVAPSILDRIIDLWLTTSPALPIDRYTFVDLGAGKGRALMAATLHPFRAAVGIELNPALAAVARGNLERFVVRAPILTEPTLVEADVLEAELPAGPLLVFLFNPFRAPLLRRFVKRLLARAASEPAPVDILYVNAEHLLTLDTDPHLTRLFHGLIPMTAEDHLADLAEIANQKDYGSTGDETCTIHRLIRSLEVVPKPAR